MFYEFCKQNYIWMFWTWSLSQSWDASTSLFQNFVRSSRDPLVPPYSVGRISVQLKLMMHAWRCWQRFVQPLLRPYPDRRVSVEFADCGKIQSRKLYDDDRDSKKWQQVEYKLYCAGRIQGKIKKVKHKLQKRGSHLFQDRPPGHCNPPENICSTSQNFWMQWKCVSSIAVHQEYLIICSLVGEPLGVFAFSPFGVLSPCLPLCP